MGQISFPILIVPVGWCLSVLSGVCLLYWLYVLMMIHINRRSMPRLSDGLGVDELKKNPPLVSVIMPAHNEQRVIDEALTFLRESDWMNLEFIVVADRCTDETQAIVERHASEDSRVHCVTVDECADGWTGKCHAAWCGAKQASGSWYLFTDADTLFAPDLVRASVGLAVTEGYDFLSLLGTLEGSQGFEKTAQPVAAMALMAIFPLHRANRKKPDRRRPFANGQFMLFDSKVYHSIGTHERVKRSLLEDLLFALVLKKHNYRVGITLAGDRFRIRMYSSLDRFRQGWKRIFTESANRNIPRLRRFAWRFRMQAVVPIVVVPTLVCGVALIGVDLSEALFISGIAVGACLSQTAALAWVYRMSGASVFSIWRFPFGCFTVASIFSEAICDLKSNRGIEWGERHYAIEQKDEILRKDEQ